MKFSIAVIGLLCVLGSCQNNKQKEQISGKEDSRAKELLQGIWLDDDSENILLKVQGDTIYYADALNAPVYFEIRHDSLYMYGNEVSRYRIDKLAEHIFWFHSLADNIVKLHKSDDPNDTVTFTSKSLQIIPAYTEVTSRDSVVMYNGERYRAYVYINPSKMKVIRTSYSDEGISVDNVYYDNVMHICVYQGKKRLYASDVVKSMFEGVVPEEFLEKAILSDMHFTGINSSGYHYRASLCIPETSVCYLVNLDIDRTGKLSLSIVK